MNPDDYKILRQLFDDYLQMYATRDDRLTTYFSQDFSGFTGGGDFLVKDQAEWVAITRQDFAQVKEPLRIELKDLAIQALSKTIAVTTGFFTIHLPIKDHILSKETARLVLIFRQETSGWKISHSSISIPYHLVQEGEIYPMEQLMERNQFLERQVTDRTIQLSEVNAHLQRTNEKLVREIAERKHTEQQIRHLVKQLKIEKKSAQLSAVTDSLTGLSNRRHFDEIILMEFYRLKRSGSSLSLILLDIDHFKKFNDFYGHLAGDTCLKKVGAALTSVAGRAPDVVARYGGEEFVVVLPATEMNGAKTLAKRIRQSIEDLALPHAASEVADHVTISLGVVTISSAADVQTPQQIIAMADTALYTAKRAGRNRFVIYAENPS